MCSDARFRVHFYWFRFQGNSKVWVRFRFRFQQKVHKFHSDSESSPKTLIPVPIPIPACQYLVMVLNRKIRMWPDSKFLSTIPIPRPNSLIPIPLPFTENQTRVKGGVKQGWLPYQSKLLLKSSKGWSVLNTPFTSVSLWRAALPFQSHDDSGLVLSVWFTWFWFQCFCYGHDYIITYISVRIPTKGIGRPPPFTAGELVIVKKCNLRWQRCYDFVQVLIILVKKNRIHFENTPRRSLTIHIWCRMYYYFLPKERENNHCSA